jgi:hypothetical protein
MVERPYSSSSFIIPPATGHHRWSGAGKNNFMVYNFLIQYYTIIGVKTDRGYKKIFSKKQNKN